MDSTTPVAAIHIWAASARSHSKPRWHNEIGDRRKSVTSPRVISELDGLVEGQGGWPASGFVLTTTGRTPISGITKAKNALDLAAGEDRNGKPLDGWRIHDLRRTMATGFQRLGIRFEVTEATLNHVSGSKAGVAGIYQKHDWKEEKRSALEIWARHVVAIDQQDVGHGIVSMDAARRRREAG